MELLTEVPASWDGVNDLMTFVDRAERDLFLTEDQAYLARLAVEEVATNLVKYMAGGPNGVIRVACVTTDAGLLRLTISDQGEPFDSSVQADPELDGNAENRDVGGLGLFLLRNLADTLDYSVGKDGWNTLTVVKGSTVPTLDRDLLRRVPLFSTLDEPAFARLAAMLGSRSLAAGETLFYEGEPGDNCYVVLSGELDILTTVGGAELRLEKRRAGHVIGEMALIDHGPRSATIRAVTPSTLAVLDEPSFFTLMHGNPQMALEMLRTATTRQRRNNQNMIGALEIKNAELRAAYDDLKAAQHELIRLGKIEEELAVARRIQSYFLPRELPQPAGWQVAALNRGAEEVGGDFYDVIALTGGALALIVADVSGKGVPAALFVALTRSLIRAATQAPWAFQGNADVSAEDVLTGAMWLANDYITREHGETSMFITLFYGLLHPETGALTYINAGHNPPLLVRPAGEAQEIFERANLPLGILESQPYEPSYTMIGPGETLVLFSDGITEAMDQAGILYSDERLVTVLGEQRGLEAPALIDAIMTDVAAHVAGAPQSDDMTLLVVRRV